MVSSKVKLDSIGLMYAYLKKERMLATKLKDVIKSLTNELDKINKFEQSRDLDERRKETNAIQKGMLEEEIVKLEDIVKDLGQAGRYLSPKKFLEYIDYCFVLPIDKDKEEKRQDAVFEIEERKYRDGGKPLDESIIIKTLGAVFKEYYPCDAQPINPKVIELIKEKSNVKVRKENVKDVLNELGYLSQYFPYKGSRKLYGKAVDSYRKRLAVGEELKKEELESIGIAYELSYLYVAGLIEKAMPTVSGKMPLVQEELEIRGKKEEINSLVQIKLFFEKFKDAEFVEHYNVILKGAFEELNKRFEDFDERIKDYDFNKKSALENYTSFIREAFEAFGKELESLTNDWTKQQDYMCAYSTMSHAVDMLDKELEKEIRLLTPKEKESIDDVIGKKGVNKPRPVQKIPTDEIVRYIIRNANKDITVEGINEYLREEVFYDLEEPFQINDSNIKRVNTRLRGRLGTIEFFAHKGVWNFPGLLDQCKHIESLKNLALAKNKIDLENVLNFPSTIFDTVIETEGKKEMYINGIRLKEVAYGLEVYKLKKGKSEFKEVFTVNGNALMPIDGDESVVDDYNKEFEKYEHLYKMVEKGAFDYCDQLELLTQDGSIEITIWDFRDHIDTYLAEEDAKITAEAKEMSDYAHHRKLINAYNVVRSTFDSFKAVMSNKSKLKLTGVLEGYNLWSRAPNVYEIQPMDKKEVRRLKADLDKALNKRRWRKKI